MSDAMDERTCIICGCTDSRACIGPDGIPCHWFYGDENDNEGICSECVRKAKEARQKAAHQAQEHTPLAKQRKVTKCKGCGAPIFFEQGVPWFAKKVPVLVTISGMEFKDTGYVSHFMNCPKAAEFSKGRKGAPR